MLCFKPLLLLLLLLNYIASRAESETSSMSRLAPPPAPAGSSSSDSDGDDDYSSVTAPASGSSGSGSFPLQPQLQVLAPKRTSRKDPLNRFTTYTAGWNISNPHYWASVGYSAAPFFLTCAAWFLIFIALALTYIFRLNNPPSATYSPIAHALSPIALLLFCLLAAIGCIVLHTGQAKFHSTITTTLEYVADQASATSHNLTGISSYLSAAKQIEVDQVSLPPNTKTEIDQTQINTDASATTLVHTTTTTSKHIINLTQTLRLSLIALTLVMLLLIFLGLVFSLLGKKIPVYMLVVTAWIIVTGTLILCGIFLLLHNATGDTCVAMNQWVQMNSVPDAAAGLHTALDDVMGCVDRATIQEAYSKTKQVTSQLVDLVNTVITNVSNLNFSPSFPSMYFNQSGPLVPTLCNPFHLDLTDRPCTPGEVDLNNATQAWTQYVCQTQTQNQTTPTMPTMPFPSTSTTNGICITTGRLTPTVYDQMAAAVNVSNGLYQYGPIVAQLEDCSFVRQTFSNVNTIYCPVLTKYSERIYVGLSMVAVAVMLSIVFWVIYVRARHHRLHKPTAKEDDNVAVDIKAQHQHQS